MDLMHNGYVSGGLDTGPIPRDPYESLGLDDPDTFIPEFANPGGLPQHYIDHRSAALRKGWREQVCTLHVEGPVTWHGPIESPCWLCVSKRSEGDQ